MPQIESVKNASQGNQLSIDEKKVKKTDKCQKGLQGSSIGLSSLGVITTVAIAIILATAPLLLPAIAFKALLISGASMLLLGVALAICAIAKSCKKISPQEQKLQKELAAYRNEQTALLNQVNQANTRLTQAGNEKQEVERRLLQLQAQLNGTEEELKTAQVNYQKLQSNNPNQIALLLEEKEALIEKKQLEIFGLGLALEEKDAAIEKIDKKYSEELKDANQKLDEMIKSRNQYKSGYEVGGKTIAEHNKSIKALESKLQKLDELNKSYISLNLTDKEEIAILRKQLTESKEALKKYTSVANLDLSKQQLELTQLSDKVEELKKNLQIVEAEKKEADEAYDAVDNEYRLLEQQLKDNEELHAKKIEEMKLKLSEEVGKEKKLNIQLLEENKGLKGQFDQLNQEYAKLDEISKTSSSLKKEVENLKSEIGQLKHDSESSMIQAKEELEKEKAAHIQESLNLQEQQDQYNNLQEQYNILHENYENLDVAYKAQNQAMEQLVTKKNQDSLSRSASLTNTPSKITSTTPRSTPRKTENPPIIVETKETMEIDDTSKT